MQKNKASHAGTNLKQKITLICLGIAVFLTALELGLRLAGHTFDYLQEKRNRASLRLKGAYRIMCLGESTTAGGKESYPAQLEEILNQRFPEKHFSVINKGKNGVSTAYILAQLQNNLQTYSPDMVIVMMGINDGAAHMPYEYDIRPSLPRSLRIYKLWRLLRLRVTNIGKRGYADKRPQPGLDDFIRQEERLKKAHADIELGWLYIKYGEPRKAETTFRDILGSQPWNLDAYDGLACAYQDLGEFKQAEETIKKGISLNPDNVRGYLRLGFIYKDQDRLSEAVELFKKSLELDPRAQEAFFALGSIYHSRANFPRAEEAFKKALEIDPRRNDIFAALGWCYLEQGKFKEAEAVFKKALEINPYDDRPYGGLASIYEALKKPEAARQYHQKAECLRGLNYDPALRHNYLELKMALDKKGVKLVCMQYPMRSIEPLKKIFSGQAGVVFIDNERIFKDAAGEYGYREYFTDIFGGDFGHCTPKGNRMIAENIAQVLSAEGIIGR